MRRTKAERRHNDWTKIHHKAAIIKHVWQDEECIDLKILPKVGGWVY